MDYDQFLGREQFSSGPAGYGKTIQQCLWANEVAKSTSRPVLIFVPLALAKQAREDAAKFGVNVTYVRDGGDITEAGVYATNYERQGNFDPSDFSGVAFDTSFSLKYRTECARTKLIERWAAVPHHYSAVPTLGTVSQAK